MEGACSTDASSNCPIPRDLDSLLVAFPRTKRHMDGQTAKMLLQRFGRATVKICSFYCGGCQQWLMKCNEWVKNRWVYHYRLSKPLAHERGLPFGIQIMSKTLSNPGWFIRRLLPLSQDAFIMDLCSGQAISIFKSRRAKDIYLSGG